jgi:hypothetical protein
MPTPPPTFSSRLPSSLSPPLIYPPTLVSTSLRPQWFRAETRFSDKLFVKRGGGGHSKLPVGRCIVVEATTGFHTLLQVLPGLSKPWYTPIHRAAIGCRGPVAPPPTGYRLSATGPVVGPSCRLGNEPVRLPPTPGCGLCSPHRSSHSVLRPCSGLSTVRRDPAAGSLQCVVAL